MISLSPESAAAIAEALTIYRQAEESGDQEAIAAALTRVCTAIGAALPPPLDHEAAALEIALSEVLAPDTPEEIMAAIAAKPDLAIAVRARAQAAGQPAAHSAGQSLPDPVLWQDDGDPNEPRHAVLSAGEIAILTGAGGLGKSTLTLQLARAASAANTQNHANGAACGLRVRAGPVAVLSYEDSPARIAHRLASWGTDPKDVPTDIQLWEEPAPIWQGNPDERGASKRAHWWTDWWAGIRARRTQLVIIDPISAALADVSTSEMGPVRAFLRSLTAEARRAQCGVLLVAHSTKTARDAAKKGDDPGAGIVAGSAAWYDGARGVLSLTETTTLKNAPQSDRRWELRCDKANYGPSKWDVTLKGQFDGKDWRGFRVARTDQPAPRIDPDA